MWHDKFRTSPTDQIFISTTVFLIQVRYHQDVLWLTAQKPMSLLDFQQSIQDDSARLKYKNY
jgi:hypothetical protein